MNETKRSFEIYGTIRLRPELKTGKDILGLLIKNGHYVSDACDWVLRSKEFNEILTSAHQEKVYGDFNIYRASACEITGINKTSIAGLHRAIKHFGGSPFPEWLMPILRIDFTNQPNEERLHAIMQPVKCHG